MCITKSLWASRLDFRLRSLGPSTAEAMCPTPVYIYKYVHYFHWLLKVHCRHCLTCSTSPHLLSCPPCLLKDATALHCTWAEGCCQLHPIILVDESLQIKDHLSGGICKAGFKESWGRCNLQRRTQAVTSICYSIAGGKLCKITDFLKNLGGCCIMCIFGQFSARSGQWVASNFLSLVATAWCSLLAALRYVVHSFSLVSHFWRMCGIFDKVKVWVLFFNALPALR